MSFEVQVVDMVEHEDGSCTVTIDLTKEAKEFFIEQGFIAVLKNAIDESNPTVVT